MKRMLVMGVVAFMLGLVLHYQEADLFQALLAAFVYAGACIGLLNLDKVVEFQEPLEDPLDKDT